MYLGESVSTREALNNPTASATPIGPVPRDRRGMYVLFRTRTSSSLPSR